MGSASWRHKIPRITKEFYDDLFFVNNIYIYIYLRARERELNPELYAWTSKPVQSRSPSKPS